MKAEFLTKITKKWIFRLILKIYRKKRPRYEPKTVKISVTAYLFVIRHEQKLIFIFLEREPIHETKT